MMDAITQEQQEGARSAKTWPSVLGFLLPMTAVLLFWGLGRLDNTTELTPDHDRAMTTIFIVTGIFAVAGIGVATRIWKALPWWRVTVAAFACALIFSIFAFMLLWRCMDFWFAWRDFPVAQTRTFPALLQISRAYATHGKSASFNIQTMPLWSNMEIAEHDYRFMQANRRPDDPGTSPDAIRSKGYFCARVTMQQAGEALRVLHAGDTMLPEGTVTLCPWLPTRQGGAGL